MQVSVIPAQRRPRRLRFFLALGIAAVSLAGCVVYPNGGYGGGYYAPAPAYYAPPVVFGFGYGGGWGRGGGRWR